VFLFIFMLEKLKREMQELSDPKRAEVNKWFFKTGPGQYGEGTQFIGVGTADKRRLAKKYIDLSLEEVQKLLDDEVHDFRFLGLVILTNKFTKSKDKKIVDFYLKNTKNINNWDLVDLSSYKILGEFLRDKDKSVLYKLAQSENLWERRIAVISCFAFIRNNDFKDALKISEMLLEDEHDLIHKAVGWMLREVGKRNQSVLEGFLKNHYKKMPRTMLRYSIERFEEDLRKKYLCGEV